MLSPSQIANKVLARVQKEYPKMDKTAINEILKFHNRNLMYFLKHDKYIRIYNKFYIYGNRKHYYRNKITVHTKWKPLDK